MDSEGSAYAENEKWLDSIEGKTTQLTNSMQDLWNKTLNSDVIKFFLDLAKGIVDVTKNVGLLKTAFAAFVGYKAFSSKTDFGNIIQFLQSVTSGVTGVKAKFSAIGAALQEVNVKGKLASIGIQGLNAALSTLTTIGIAWAIQGLITLFYNLATATQRAMESASEAVNEYKNTTSSIENQKKTVDELASTYQKLASGVNTETNTNIGLTTESYQEYLDVCNQIANIYPELVTGYDAQGNAILSLKGKVDELTNSYKQAQEEAASTLLTAENKKNIWTTYENTAGKVIAEGTIKDGTKYIKTTVADQQKILKSIASMTDSELSQMYEYDKSGNAAMWDVLREQLKETGSYIDDATMINAFNELNIGTGVSLDEYKSTLKSKLTDINKEVATGMNGIKQTVSASLIFDETYQNLDESSQGIVRSIINGIDMDMMKESGAENIDEFYSWFSSKIIDKIANTDYQDLFTNINSISDELAKAMANGDSNTFKDAKSRFNEMIQDWVDAKGNIEIDPDADAATQYLQKLAKGIQEQSKNYEVRLQMQTDFESPTKVNELITKYTGDYQKEIKDAFDDLELGDNAIMKDAYGKISEALAGEDGIFSSNELSDFYDQYAAALASGDESLQTLKDNGWSDAQIQAIQAVDAVMKLYSTDIDTVKSKLIELGYVAPLLKDVGVFDLSSESTQKQIEQFESDIKSIKESWNSLNDGDMTKSEFIELAMQFPDLMNGVNLSDDNWMVKAKQNLEELYNTTFTGENGFITSLEKQKQAMEAEGQDTSQLDSFLNYAYQLQNMSLFDEEANTIPDTISEIESAYENYKNIIEETNEVLYDGQKVSEDYYNSLKDYIDDVEELDSCFDKNNKSIVTNTKKLKQLITRQKQETLNLTRTARAQSQLQYQELVKDLYDAINAYDGTTKAGFNEIDSLLQQIDTVQDTINQYKQLELSLLGATNAFEEFQKAKEIDSATDYESDVEEMVQAIYEGFDTGKVGTEAFNAAIKAILRPEIYGDLADSGDLDAVWREIFGGEGAQTDISKFITYSKDDGFSITLQNMENFVAKAQEMGVLTGETFDEFDMAANVTLKKFAEAMGLSEDATYAFLEMLSDYSIGGETLIGKLADVKFDKDIENATNELDALLKKKAEFLRSGYYNPEDMNQLNADIETAKQNLEAANQAAINHADTYSTLAMLNNGLTGSIEMTSDELNYLAERLSAIDGTQYTISANGKQLIDADGSVIDIQTRLEELGGEPTIFEIQFNYDKLNSELDELQNKRDEISTMTEGQVVLKYGTDKTSALASVDSDIEELQGHIQRLEVMYNLTPSDEGETTSIVETFQTWEAEGVNTELNVDTTKATTNVDEAKTAMEEPINVDMNVNVQTQQADVETNGGTGVTVEYHTDNTSYEQVMGDLAALQLECAEPANKTVKTDDNDTTKSIHDELISLDEQTIADKSFNVSMTGNYTVTSQLDTIKNKLTEIDGMTATATINVQTNKSGGVGVDGTAHALGTALKDGSWGAKKTETALVGELGPEMLVRNGRWTTIGENGAEFTQVKKGDIIFNHKQTEDLLRNGYVTSRGHIVGGAFAEGNAYNLTYTKHYNDSGTQNTSGSLNETSKNLSNASDSLSNAADSLSDAADDFEDVFDWIAVRIEEIDEKLNLLNAQLENAVGYTNKNNIIDSMIGVNNTKLTNLTAGLEKYTAYASKLLAEIPAQYQAAAQDGMIAITEFAGEADEATIEAINNYREWAQKVADLRQQLEETKTTIRDLAIEKFDNAYKYGDVRATVEDSQTEKLQNAVDYDKERGLITSDAYYIAMMENSNKKIEYLTNARQAMQKELDAAVKSGQLIRGSNEWYELIDQMYEIDSAIDDATMELEEFQNAINDLYWDRFDELINRLDYLQNETQSLIDLMDNADMVTKPEGKTYDGGTVKYWTADDVQWTEEGIATLGLYAQQMEIAEYTARQYAKAIDDLQKDYKAGKYSENEYLEKLNELKDAQYENIEAYYDAQDAIKELNKTRIDAIKEGIEKEIDAYSELIDKKKQELTAEKDLYDFQKSVAKQQKSISDLERKLAALSGDNSASAIAQRKKLEAELAEARADLEDQYYDRSISDRQDALDKEQEDFENEKNAEIEKWEEYLENVEQVVADSLMVVQDNALGVYATLSEKAQEYDLTLSDAIMTPWQDGALAVSDYQTSFDTAMSSTMNQLEALKMKWQEVIDKMAEAGNKNVANINKENANYAAATDTKPAKPRQPSAPSNPMPTQKSAPSVGQTVRVKSSATHFSAQSGNAKMASFVPGSSYQVMQVGVNGDKSQILIGKNGQYTGWVWLKDLEGYAKGTTGVKKSGFAITDENDLEELVLHAGPDGRLQYLTKGSSVLTSDITNRLMDLAMNPQDMLDRNRPEIKLSPEIHNTEINLNISYGDMLHIEEFNSDDPDEIAKIVAKQFEKHTRDLNNSLRKYVR